ncbi:hypothetical protein C8A05DRAFT_47843 [Staphylotrichum tortipilum]|uniref:WW domain-containing protein n=1 Tax=Staphylotrichum tortipilum TaxID=2831512 RepID=A0AAN6MCT1_9PEZI|nr:hypothetical protein C8A05DRAFT_47843 [Staphylotrichum longicolle]
MAGLPENWEWDYDGTRWFYRYKPTGLIQYSFPKPGDEFPEFVGDAGTVDLAPEEKLVSQQQIKRRSTLGESSKTTRRDRAVSNAVSDPDDGSGPFWLQPDGLMYMGPGAYNDISPLQEEEDERGLGDDNADEKADASQPPPDPATTIVSETVVAAPVTATAIDNTSNSAQPPPTRSQISPVASTETTPLVINSHPATTTPELDSIVVVAAAETIPVDAGVVHVPPPEVPLLDSREVPYNPIGFVAELPTELTARCDDEVNPAPVEMPSNEIMQHSVEPAPYVNAFHLAPAELASDPAPPRRVATTTLAAEEKSLSSENPGQEKIQAQQQRAYQAAQELLNHPYRQTRPPPVSQPPASLGSQQPIADNTLASDPVSGKYQPYNPSQHAAYATAVNRFSIIETRDRQPAGENKRHSLAGPPLPSQFQPSQFHPPQLQPSHSQPLRFQPSQSQFQPSAVPPALRPPHVPPKLPLDSSSDSAGASHPAIPGASARHGSISISAPPGATGGLSHYPSVLQPARGRPGIRAQSPPQSQGASPAPTYRAYKPYQDLQRDIEDTVQVLSNTGYGQPCDRIRVRLDIPDGHPGTP